MVLVCWTCLSACVLDSTAPSDAAQITSFDLLTGNNPELTEDVIGVVGDTTITLHVPADTDLTSLVPTVQHNGDHISPAANEPQDFSDPIDYSVIAADGSAHTYRVTVDSAPSSRKDIKGFRIESVPGVINGTNITLTLPYGTDVSMLRGYVTYTGKTVIPESGSIQDFRHPVEYTVIAQDGTSITYVVTVETAPSSAKDITELSIGAVMANIDGTQISLTLPNGTDLHALEPSILHTGVSISPESGSAQDFSAPVTYTVTAADGSTKKYVVTVNIAQSDSKEITKLTWSGRTASISGTAITLIVPYGTDLTNIAPTILHTGKSISPASGSARNFTRPVQYTVTAADGSTQVYTVTVSIAPNTAHEITELTIMGVQAQINGTAITLTLPFGTAVSNLVPTISHTGESISPQSGLAQNFSAPVDYTVTAADGSAQVYTVTVTVAKNSSREITMFSLLGVNASMITGDAITVTVPYGSDIASAVPVLTHNGESIQPAANVPQDFRSSVVYTVTASNGQTRMYTVTVTVALNSAKDISAFSIGNVPGTLGPHSIALTLPYGTDLSMLQPTIAITGASVNPASNAPQSFATPVTYTVTAEDQSTKQYVVTVSVAKADAKEITGFSIQGSAGKISATGVTVTLPSGANVLALSPDIIITGKSVSPASGEPRDFTNPVIYTVTADDGSTKNVPVTVNVAAPNAKHITAFSIEAIPATRITSDTVTLTLPNGTNLTRLTPTIQTDGVSVSPASLTQRNFSTPKIYAVSAADGSHQDYTVTVNVPPSDAKDILSFDVLGITPTIGNDTITLTVPFGTTVTGLMPIVVISGSSVTPASGQAVDFTNPVLYTVRDANGATKTYTVTVSVAPT